MEKKSLRAWMETKINLFSEEKIDTKGSTTRPVAFFDVMRVTDYSLTAGLTIESSKENQSPTG